MGDISEDFSYDPSDFEYNPDDFDYEESDNNDTNVSGVFVEEPPDNDTSTQYNESGDSLGLHESEQQSTEPHESNWKVNFLLVLSVLLVIIFFVFLVLPALDNSNHSFTTDVIEKSNEEDYWKDVLRKAN